MYIVKGLKKTCSTCDHWMGLRALEEGGIVYSLENVEGICKGAGNAGSAEADRVLMAPMACCASWEKWSDIPSGAGIPQGNKAHGAVAYSI